MDFLITHRIGTFIVAAFVMGWIVYDLGIFQDRAIRTFVPAPPPPPPPTDEYILSKLDPWTIACAVGAMNGSIYGAVGAHGNLSFENWARAVNKSEWRTRTGMDDPPIIDALRRFATAEKHKHMNQVLREVEKARGKPVSIVLAPGESVTFTLPLIHEKDDDHADQKDTQS